MSLINAFPLFIPSSEMKPLPVDCKVSNAKNDDSTLPLGKASYQGQTIKAIIHLSRIFPKVGDIRVAQ